MEYASASLSNGAAVMDHMNVFPVADGDTGRNMAVTLQGAVQAMRGEAAGPIGYLMARAADGALMSARGNSGVILSQILQGMADALAGALLMGPAQLGAALQGGAARARQHVAAPQEGTILTVADAAAAAADATRDLVACLATALAAAERALIETTQMLPQLAGTHMVDAGALGYVLILRGWQAAAQGDAPPGPIPSVLVSNTVVEIPFSEPPTKNYYDVEALVYNLRSRDAYDRLAEQLPTLGDSIVLAPGRDQIKVHVHTHRPVDLMRLLTAMGDIYQMEWQDMRSQVAAHRALTLTIVGDEEIHPVFAAMFPVTRSEDARDEPDTLWVMPVRPLELGVAAASVGLAGQAMLEYVPGESWDVNKERLVAQLESMQSWLIERTDHGYTFAGDVYGSREGLLAVLAPRVSRSGIVTLYLTRAAQREEAEYWQDAFNAELVQVPVDHPWMEIVWQP